ncbi:2Fe-2S iron-sulfur cluster-binding protein, partial [Campylobacter coli]|uniref:2Fe-2S iron-sulfur cluster-binding protein n=1 Tax=Campylobacter coli TaxID=195 RepID=UPI001F30AA65
MIVIVYMSIIREKMDADLSFDFVCQAEICGNCAMMINGVTKLACKTLTKDYSDGDIGLMPMPGFRHINELSVNTDEWFEDMCK